MMLIPEASFFRQVRDATLGGRALYSRLLAGYRKQKVYAGFDTVQFRFYHDLWKQAAAHVGAQIEDMGYGFRRISRHGITTFVQQGEVMLDNHLVLKLAGNKPLFNTLLAEWGYRTLAYCEYDLASLHRALAFLQQVGKACVIKPAASGAAGKGITTNIRDAKSLRKASFFAAGFSKKLMIEPQAEGGSFRLLYLDGKFIDGIRRDPPVVVGDGKATIKELIARENQHRQKSVPPRALHPITIDLECEACLRAAGRGLQDVPAPGEKVQVKNVVNQNSCEENHNVRTQVHPEIVEAGAAIAGKLGIRLAGFDVLAPDISQPLEKTGGMINEVNTKPGLHHHYLISDPAAGVAVADLILELLLQGK